MNNTWICVLVLILLFTIVNSVNAADNPSLNNGFPDARIKQPSPPESPKISESSWEIVKSNPEEIIIYPNASDTTVEYIDRIVTIENANKTRTVWINVIAGPYGRFRGTTTQCQPSDCSPSGTCCPTVSCPELTCGNNRCNQGTLSLPNNGGFILGPGKSTRVIVKVLKNKQTLTGAGGITVWARTGCKPTGNKKYPLVCDTANCDLGGGLSKVACGGIGSKPPATKAEITFDGNGRDHIDNYDISLVDGYNVPMTLVPVSGNYKLTSNPYWCRCGGGVVDLIPLAQKQLPLMVYKVNRKAVGVYSACQYSVMVNPKKEDPAFCCSGTYANDPNGCAKNVKNWPKNKQTALFFRHYYPKAYSFAYGDNIGGLFTCKPDNNKPINYKLTIFPTKMT